MAIRIRTTGIIRLFLHFLPGPVARNRDSEFLLQYLLIWKRIFPALPHLWTSTKVIKLYIFAETATQAAAEDEVEELSRVRTGEQILQVWKLHILSSQ